jgi:hypothetical protein
MHFTSQRIIAKLETNEQLSSAIHFLAELPLSLTTQLKTSALQVKLPENRDLSANDENIFRQIFFFRKRHFCAKYCLFL